MIERIFSGAVTRGGVKSGGVIQQPEDKMSYTEFVWFLLSEEDKNHPTAIEYWFRYKIIVHFLFSYFIVKKYQ